MAEVLRLLRVIEATAVDLIGRAVAVQPDNAAARTNLGNAYRATGQVDQAIATCRRATALRPGVPEAYSNLGNALRDKGQLDKAIAALGQAIDLKADYAEAHTNLGLALRDKGLADEATTALIVRPIANPDRFDYNFESRERRLLVSGPTKLATEGIGLSGGWTASDAFQPPEK